MDTQRPAGHLDRAHSSPEAQQARGREISARRLCLGDEDRAQDLAQDALLRAYDACLRGRFQEGTNTSAGSGRTAPTSTS